eukprot:CAMPEP_0180617128 /NCGR_PEP_ID=MMETSP1037_2-20121125/32853_1 /TAXON_ID=632150 /ORGANISM="Azadinium spinosum, Strain 3D9" /LENGTH=147 /DNA_ID=CAMNT_0022637023 /DNA_START=90 /DNA_END=529 /DNA_ORIENTATION=+
MVEPNGGLEGTIKERRWANQERKWQAKQRRFFEEQEEKKRAEEAAEEKRRLEAEKASEKVKQVIFQPNASAIADPKAYFAQWQQFTGQGGGPAKRPRDAAPRPQGSRGSHRPRRRRLGRPASRERAQGLEPQVAVQEKASGRDRKWS